MTDGKHCTKCGEWKPWDGFSKQSRARDGHKPWCKTCMREYLRGYYEANRDQIAEQRRGYREANRDRIAEYFRDYHAVNRDNPQYRARMKANTHKRRSRMAALPSELVLLREIALRDGAHCWMCGDELSEWNPAHLDHLIPLAADEEILFQLDVMNPGTTRENMALACPSCNMGKSNRVLPCAVARYLKNVSKVDLLTV